MQASQDTPIVVSALSLQRRRVHFPILLTACQNVQPGSAGYRYNATMHNKDYADEQAKIALSRLQINAALAQVDLAGRPLAEHHSF